MGLTQLISAAISGSTVDSTPIGQTTPAAANFTTPASLADNSQKAATTAWVQSLLTSLFGVSSSLTARGYLKIAGLTIQWGNDDAAASSVTATFATAFTTAVWAMIAMPLNYGTNAGRASPYLTSVGLTSAIITSAGSTGNYFWIAVGK